MQRCHFSHIRRDRIERMALPLALPSLDEYEAQKLPLTPPFQLPFPAWHSAFPK